MEKEKSWLSKMEKSMKLKNACAVYLKTCRIGTRYIIIYFSFHGTLNTCTIRIPMDRCMNLTKLHCVWKKNISNIFLLCFLIFSHIVERRSHSHLHFKLLVVLLTNITHAFCWMFNSLLKYQYYYYFRYIHSNNHSLSKYQLEILTRISTQK